MVLFLPPPHREGRGESLPSYWLDAVLFQILVGLDEMTATEETSIDRERRGVRCFEHQVFAVVDDVPFLSGITAPKKEDKMLAMLRQGGNGGIRESLPTLALMATCHAGLHRERGIEQQDALVCPMRQVAVALTVVEIILVRQLLIYIDQRRRNGDAW